MVSIVVPVFNSEKVIGRCIESIMAQTYKEWELILIDDGSTDHSLEICEKYADEDQRIKVFHQENRGASATRNHGIELAEGEYLQFVDSDDYIAKEMVEKLVNNIDETGADLVICGCVELHPDHTYELLPEIEKTVNVRDLKNEYPNIFEKFLLNSPCNKLYKVNKVTTGFPEEISLGEDLIFNLKYVRGIEKISFLPEVFYYYEIHDQSLNRKYREDSIAIAERLYLENMRFSKEYDMGCIAEKHISSIFIRFLLYGFSDLYAVSDHSGEKRKELLKFWVNNANVERAVKYAEKSGLYQKVAQFLIAHKNISGLVFLFNLKAKLRK